MEEVPARQSVRNVHCAAWLYCAQATGSAHCFEPHRHVPGQGEDPAHLKTTALLSAPSALELKARTRETGECRSAACGRRTHSQTALAWLAS